MALHSAHTRHLGSSSAVGARAPEPPTPGPLRKPGRQARGGAPLSSSCPSGAAGGRAASARVPLKLLQLEQAPHSRFCPFPPMLRAKLLACVGALPANGPARWSQARFKPRCARRKRGLRTGAAKGELRGGGSPRPLRGETRLLVRPLGPFSPCADFQNPAELSSLTMLSSSH